VGGKLAMRIVEALAIAFPLLGKKTIERAFEA
jgi:hypothetical protein